MSVSSLLLGIFCLKINGRYVYVLAFIMKLITDPRNLVFDSRDFYVNDMKYFLLSLTIALGIQVKDKKKSLSVQNND